MGLSPESDSSLRSLPPEQLQEELRVRRELDFQMREARELMGAKRAVQETYVAQLLSSIQRKDLSTQSRDQHKDRWETIAEQYPSYYRNILAIGKAVTMAEFERYYRAVPATDTYRSLYFSGIEDRKAQYFLADILFGRIGTPNQSEQNLTRRRNPASEADIMLKQLGINDGLLDGNPLVTFDSAIEYAISGKLKTRK